MSGCRQGTEVSQAGAAAPRQFNAGPPPLALYVHWPWCLRKCPYCDFNSHPAPGHLPQAAYVDALLADLDADLADSSIQERIIESIFIGGGTPSLIAGHQLKRLLAGIRQRLPVACSAEITLEANPGASDAGRFEQYLSAGVNRLSIGVQSLSATHLPALGRVHDPLQARQAVAAARDAGCTNLNLDCMFGLPAQSLLEARQDLDDLVSLEPDHLSYYQLTLEPETDFARHPPALPDDDLLADMAEQGQAVLASAGFARYEVSAFAKPARRCQHNLNYWTFGDYLGIGAGAHGKWTDVLQGQVLRRVKIPNPDDYFAAFDRCGSAEHGFIADGSQLSDSDLVVEFALNALRLCDGVAFDAFDTRTGLGRDRLRAGSDCGCALGLLEQSPNTLRATEQGLRFLDRLLECFAPDPDSAQ